MANHSEATDALINRFLSNLPTVDAQVVDASSIKTPNSPFDTPASGLWIALETTFANSVSIQASETGYQRVTGIFIIDIFTEKGTGNKAIKQLSTQIFDLYKRKRFDNIRTTGLNQIDLGVTEGWKHDQLNITFEFELC